MDKEAIAIPLSPDEEYEASQLVGKSLFSAIQLAKEQERRRNQAMYSSGDPKDSSVLRIPIPEELVHAPKMAEQLGEDPESGLFASAMRHISKHPARMLFGGQQGFRDAKKDYYVAQKAQMQQELMDAQKEYIDTLSRIKMGSVQEPETPLVDAFCSGMAHAAVFGKTASYKDVQIEDDSAKQMLNDLKAQAVKPFRPVGNYAAEGLMNTAAGTAYLTYILRKKMREQPEKYLEEQMPTRVELQPYQTA
jgi:hypothetical protein